MENNQFKIITINWGTADILHKAMEMGITLSIDDANNILDGLLLNHNTNIGINWNVITLCINNYSVSLSDELNNNISKEERLSELNFDLKENDISKEVSDNRDNFVNGFDSWIETYYEIVKTITCIEETNKNSSIITATRNHKGIGGLYELSKELTYKFEKLYEGYDWHGDYYDKMDEFLKKELKYVVKF